MTPPKGANEEALLRRQRRVNNQKKRLTDDKTARSMQGRRCVSIIATQEDLEEQPPSAYLEGCPPLLESSIIAQ